MDYWDKKLMRKLLSKKMNKLRPLLGMKIPAAGWLKTIRESLGMTLEELGDRVGLDKSRVYRIEQAEVDGDLQLSTLQKMAEGLEMTFVYGYVPDKDLEEIVREQARKIAMKRLERVDHSMKLEVQGLSDEEHKHTLNDMVDKILVEESRNIWKNR